MLLILLAAVVPARALPKRIEIRPPRADFSQFPLRVGPWSGQRDRLETVYVDALRIDDYVLANFVGHRVGATADQFAAVTAPVNLYVAYYASQRTGQSAHSPRSCLPGGGWRILDFEQREVGGVRSDGLPLRVNRAIVQHDAQRQLVYYWFQERGRDITNEYLVKWYLLEDGLLRNRTDGALIRMITAVQDNETIAAADARLTNFTGSMLPTLQAYLPN
jgi:EpsI family protein